MRASDGRSIRRPISFWLEVVTTLPWATCCGVCRRAPRTAHGSAEYFLAPLRCVCDVGPKQVARRASPSSSKMVGSALYLASLLLATTSKSPSHPTSHAPSHPTSSSHPTSTHHAHPPSSHPTKAKAPTPTQNKSPSTNNAATQHHTYAKPPPTIRYKPPPPPPHPREHVEELVYVGCYADDVEHRDISDAAAATRKAPTPAMRGRVLGDAVFCFAARHVLVRVEF